MRFLILCFTLEGSTNHSVIIAGDPLIYAVLEEVVEATFLFNSSDILEKISVQTQLCSSHLLPFLAPISIIGITTHFHIACQAKEPVLTVDYFVQLLLNKALSLFIKGDSMSQLL